MNPSNQLLLRALGLNAAFSTVSALLMLLAADWVAAQVGLPGPANVYALGVVLLLFAAGLANIVRTGQIRTLEIVTIIAADLGWVAGSVILGIRYYEGFSTIGLWLVDLVALAVLVFALLQIRGLAIYRRSEGSAAPA